MSSIAERLKAGIGQLFEVGEKNQGPLKVITLVIALFILTFALAVGFVKELNTNKEIAQVIAVMWVVLFAIFGLGLVATFFYLFRGIKADEEKLNSIINYCYAYIVFALFATVLPFIALPLIPQLYDTMTKSPIGIVAGCSVTPGPVTRPGQAPGEQGAQKDVEKPVPRTEDRAASYALDDRTIPPKELRCGMQTDQWVVNIGGTVLDSEKDAKGYRTVSIRGGLVIPLYAVVLALMGAAVSMTRRVPEFQRRISPGDAEFITFDRAREGLVFQIMQVISAPLIAVTAYYLVNPESRASTIVLSFAAGFSSETVLLLIRAILEKLKPASAMPVSKSVAVGVAPGRLDFGNVPVNGFSKKLVSITNPGPAALQVTAPTCSGEFTTSTGAFTVAPQTSGVIEVEFKPTSPGTKQGQLTIADNATGSPRSVELSGTAT